MYLCIFKVIIMNTIPIPRELKNAIQDGNLVIFVGAGISYNLVNKHTQQLEGWKNLVNQLITNLGEKEYDVEPYRMLSEKGKEPIEILELIEKDKDLPKYEIINFIKEFYFIDNLKDDSLHKNLYFLSNKIITTNYDNAFEIAVPDFTNYVAFKGKNYELASLHKTKKPTLFKLHGCISNGESMVLFPSDYEALYNNENEDAERTLFYLKNIITNKHILFIGCGMGDFQINNIFKCVQQQLGKFNKLEHYILTTEDRLDSKLDFITPIKLSDFSEINDYVSELVKIKRETQKTDEIIRLEKQLEETKKKSVENGEKAQNAEQKLESLSIDFFEDALELHLAKDYNAAIKRYNDVIKINPDFHEAFYNMGLAYDNSGEYGKTIECYKKALEIKPDFHEALNNMGNAYNNSGEYGKAIECYKKALEVKPDDHEVLNNMGFLYLRQGNFLDAKIILQKSIDLGSLDLGNMNMGHVCLAEKDEEKAFEHYRTALTHFPSKDKFFEGMEDDFQYPDQYGVTKEQYDAIINELKKY